MKIAENLKLDLVQLIDSRALVQCNSGGGKSYLLRLLAEQAGPHVQTVIIDPEGEFSTLRERLDLILVGQAGEIPANPRTAAPLARRLAETGASAVLDLSEIKLDDRRAYVRDFLTALIDLPRKLWHPMLVAIDEAHLFCPERSAGESVATDAVIGLMTLGRKRGFCGLLATQRISKLHKDAAAEANNVFIGRTSLDVDQKRAGDVLGMAKAEQQALRDLDAGEWYGFGPALEQRGVVRFHAATCRTTHPKAGERHKLKPPAPSSKVSGMVAEMADLASRDPDEALTLDEAQAIIQRLKLEHRQKLAAAERQAKAPAADQAAIDRAFAAGAAQRDREARAAVSARDKIIVSLTGRMGKAAATAGQLVTMLHVNGEAKPAEFAPAKVAGITGQKPSIRSGLSPLPARETRVVTTADRSAPDSSKTQQRILDVIATLDARSLPPDRERVARWLGIHPNGGRYGSDLAALRAQGLLEGFELTEAGQQQAVAQETGLAAALQALPDDSMRRTLQAIVDAGGGLSREELAEALGIHPNGGRYGSTLAWLRTMGIITERGPIAATPGLFA